jgi:hypothetical protein
MAFKSRQAIGIAFYAAAVVGGVEQTEKLVNFLGDLWCSRSKSTEFESRDCGAHPCQVCFATRSIEANEEFRR